MPVTGRWPMFTLPGNLRHREPVAARRGGDQRLMALPQLISQDSFIHDPQLQPTTTSIDAHRVRSF
ncbi:hypothetical protein AB0M36_34850 [Actinoplanes sp. NPDC051346]|uniref:hypothetical protein n=1 Tax=Actinoplanes sp. NPDC051346 TaxID=3155048 RepID=UPI0034274825